MAKKPQTRAQIRARAIRDLEDSQGRVTARALVDAARSSKHPMHQDFEWDDAVAGDKYRIAQARQYISEVRIPVTSSTKILFCPGYLRDPDAAPHQGHRATAKLKTDREAALSSLLYETGRLQASFERCREIAAGLECEAELDAALSAVRELEGRIRMRAAPTSVHAII